MKDTFFHVGYTAGCTALLAAMYCAHENNIGLAFVAYVTGCVVVWIAAYSLGRNSK